MEAMEKAGLQNFQGEIENLLMGNLALSLQNKETIPFLYLVICNLLK